MLCFFRSSGSIRSKYAATHTYVDTENSEFKNSSVSYTPKYQNTTTSKIDDERSSTSIIKKKKRGSNVYEEDIKNSTLNGKNSNLENNENQIEGAEASNLQVIRVPSTNLDEAEIEAKRKAKSSTSSKEDTVDFISILRCFTSQF